MRGERAQSAPQSPKFVRGNTKKDNGNTEEIVQIAGRIINSQDEDFFSKGNNNSAMLKAMLSSLREEQLAQIEERKPQQKSVQ